MWLSLPFGSFKDEGREREDSSTLLLTRVDPIKGHAKVHEKIGLWHVWPRRPKTRIKSVLNWYRHFLIETKKSELDKMCVINVVVIAYKNINYYKSSGLK